MEIFKRKFISKCKENGDLIWFFQKKVDMPLMFSRINVTYVGTVYITNIEGLKFSLKRN